MISILIPNYNYDCQNLVQVLIEEIKELDTPIEIIIADDASTSKKIRSSYAVLENFSQIRIIKNETNLGREKSRLLLAREAKYNWILFLDSDVIPKEKKFIRNFLTSILKFNEIDVVFGGINYETKPKDAQLLLRWMYGKKNEEKSLAKRLKNPYNSLVTGAICIRKSVFIEHSVVLDHIYGLDILLAAQLCKANAKVLHINNPVYHLGLEANATFLLKSQDALKSIILLEKKKLLPPNFRPIQNAYLKLKKLRLLGICNWIYSWSEAFLIKACTEKTPNLVYFKIYRMLYFCYLKKTNSIKNEAT